jgi:hypothetical protein
MDGQRRAVIATKRDQAICIVMAKQQPSISSSVVYKKIPPYKKNFEPSARSGSLCISSVTRQKKFSVLYAFFTPALPHSLIFSTVIRAAIAHKA